MARFSEGLQIRMLRAPLTGFVLFQPGRLSWRPIDGIEQAIVVHDLRVAPGPAAREAARLLWNGVEKFARYYGYALVVALTGKDAGLVSPSLAPGRGWLTLDTGPGDMRLWGRVLHGPVGLPQLPGDWLALAARSEPGLVLQTTGESASMEARAAHLARAARNAGVSIKIERLADADSARQRAVAPGAVFSVLRDGVRIGGAELSDAALLAAITRDQAPA